MAHSIHCFLSPHTNISSKLNKPTPISSSRIHHTHPLHTNTPPPYASRIQSCIDSRSFAAGKAIHARMVADGLAPDAYLLTKILMLYARSGDQADFAVARKMFDEMPERNRTAWNTMIMAHARANDHSEVVELFYQMSNDAIPPDKFTFPSVIKACVALDDDDAVSQVHALIFKTGLSSDVAVGSALVGGYAAFGLMDDAVAAFDQVEGANVVTWNAVIGGYVKASRWGEAWESFYWSCVANVGPNYSSFAAAVRTCGALRCLDRGKQVHAQVIIHGYEDDTFVANSLIGMYSECGDRESCVLVFELMKEHNQVSWNSIISSQAHLGYYEDTLLMFLRMQETGFKCDRFNLGSVLMACAGSANVRTGRSVHGYLIRRLLDSSVILGSALVDMYSKSGFMEKAQWVFDRLNEKNQVCWNALIAGYVQDEQAEATLTIYCKMREASFSPDQFTFASLLSLCANRRNVDSGKQIHASVIKNIARQNLVLETELVNMYAKCGKLKEAELLFSKMPERNAYTWNALLEGCEQNGGAAHVLELFKQMQLIGIAPDCFSLASALRACTSLLDLKNGKPIHGFLIKSMHEDHSVLRCMLVDMYIKCGSMDYACKTYHRAKEKDTILHNMMIGAFVNCGRILEARGIFDQMKEQSTISWNSILMGYVKCGGKVEAFRIFQRMVEGEVDYDSRTLILMFNLCASLPAVEMGKQFHACSIKKGLVHSSVALDCAVVDMYAKGGSIKEARRNFDRMEEMNVVSWNAMIMAYTKQGQGTEVIALYEQMVKEKIRPNDVTFLSILSACSHSGLLKEGINAFISMFEEHGIEARVEHYTCLVDLLGRAGRLDDAKRVIEMMPVEPEVSTWGALLGACKIHEDVDIGRVAFENLFMLDPSNSGHYCLMANIYAAAGRWKEADKIWELMRRKGVRKEPGASWIEIDHVVQTFHARDQTHPCAEEIYTTLRHLYQHHRDVVFLQK